MKVPLRFFTSIVAALIISGCASPPRFIHHIRPELTVDFVAFADVGCPPDENGLMLCGPESPLSVFDCDRIEEPDGLLGGLDPAYPIAYCLYDSYRHTGEDYERTRRVESEGYLYQFGGIAQTYVRFIVIVEEEFRLLKNQDDFADVFAPIDSADEALGYALAHGSYSAYYGLAPERGLRYLTDMVEDTHVEETENGYLLHLFYYQFFGCGPHTTSAIDVRVTTAGMVEEVDVQAMYENPDQDGLCVD